MIKILIVDDSPTETEMLRHIFASEQDIEVIGIAKNGEEAIRLAQLLKPDLITMDLLMPVMNGIEAIRIIMSQNPIPIVVISSAISAASSDATFQALEAGALSVLEKPHLDKETFDKIRNRIVDNIRSMAEIKVIKRRFNIKKSPKTLPEIVPPTTNGHKFELIAIGSSVGGPQAIKVILSKLPDSFPLPIVIVQHMTKGYIKGFAHWLNQHTPLHVKEADNNERLQMGYVYFAPDENHLTIYRNHFQLFARIQKGPPITGFCPSATALMRSAAIVCGKNAIGILLTGMGNDGAEGLLELKQSKGHTLIQDAKSCIVFGMAGVAQSLGAVDQVIELDQIADYLQKITQK